MEEVNEKSEYEVGLENAWKAYMEEDLIAAQTETSKLLEIYPDKVSNHILQGHIYIDQRHYKSAITEFEIAFNNDLNNEIAGYINYWLGIIYDSGGPFSEDEEVTYDTAKSRYYFTEARKTKKYPPDLLYKIRNTLSGQDLIQLWEEGILMFPNEPNFYILLAKEFKKNGLVNKQWMTLEKALGLNLNCESLFYNIGQYKYDHNEFETAIHYFEKLEENKNRFAIDYLIGKSYLSLDEIQRAELFFKRAFNNCEDENDRLFGLFGLLEVYSQSNRQDSIIEIIANLEVGGQLFSPYGLPFGGPLFLDGKYPDYIEIDNWNDLYKKLSVIKTQKDNIHFNSKLNLIKAFLADVSGKYQEAYKAIQYTWKYSDSGIPYDVKINVQSDILCHLIDYKSGTLINAKKTLKIILKDLKELFGLNSKLVPHIGYFIRELCEYKDYKGITELSTFFTQAEIEEAEVTFTVAYAHAEIGNMQVAKNFYESYLLNYPTSTAALNNLANIYKQEGNIKKALELYSEGVKLDPQDKIIIGNLEKTKSLRNEQEQKLIREKALIENYHKAVQTLKYENDYVLDKILIFIQKAKLEVGFQNWQVPIAKYKFHVFPGVDKQKGEQLRDQWLKKQYITDTSKRHDQGVTIYEINPLLEEAILKIQKNKVPANWLNGFLNIDIKSLEELDYFGLIDRISKINKKFQPLIERDVNELIHNYLMGHDKATIVLSGSLVELLLIYHCEKKKIVTITVSDSKGNAKKKKLYDCVLVDLIDFVEQTKPFGNDFYHLTNLSRIYRNYIHPGRELKDSLDKSKAEICFVSTREILNRII